MTQTLGLELPTFAELRKESAARREAEDRRHRARLLRSYDAARRNRLTNDFTTVNTSANWEMRRSLRYLRARSRNLARNNDYVKKFLSMVRNNVAGPAGMKLQARAMTPRGELDRELNRQVERAWQRWAHCENASLNGRLSWVEIQRKAVTLVARDGECVIRMMVADNEFGFALKFYSADWLDETFSERLPGGNRVIMSVELDADDRPVAYWLTPPPSDLQFLYSPATRYRTRVPAEEVVHLFLGDDENADDDNQARGVPWVHTAITRLKQLGEYELAEIVAARVGASKMGFFREEEADDDAYTGEDEGEEDGGRAALMESAQPGTFGLIPRGYTFEKWEPSHPNTSYQPFIKGVLRGVAAGMDVTYFSLAEDLEGVNYSSAHRPALRARHVARAPDLLHRAPRPARLLGVAQVLHPDGRPPRPPVGLRAPHRAHLPAPRLALGQPARRDQGGATRRRERPRHAHGHHRGAGRGLRGDDDRARARAEAHRREGRQTGRRQARETGRGRGLRRRRGRISQIMFRAVP